MLVGSESLFLLDQACAQAVFSILHHICRCHLKAVPSEAMFRARQPRSLLCSHSELWEKLSASILRQKIEWDVCLNLFLNSLFGTWPPSFGNVDRS